MRGRWALIAAGVVVFALVAGQILIPKLGEREVERRLTEGGGSADVTLGAFPAARLLFSDGERFEVEAQDLSLGLDERTEVFDKLDGFGVVDVLIVDSIAGPFELESFSLTRDGDGPYHLSSTGSALPSALVEYGFDRYELPGENIIDALLDPLLDEADVAVPVDLDMELVSEDGRVEVTSGGGTIAGIPVGRLAEVITSAIVVNL